MFYAPSSDSITKAEDEFLKVNHDKVMARAIEIEKHKLITYTATQLVALVDGNIEKKIRCIQVLRGPFPGLGLKESKDYIEAAFADFHSKDDLPF